MTDKPDEQLIVPCAGCGVPVLTWWEPNGGGLLRGSYDIIADTIWHPRCWDEHYAKHFPHEQRGSDD